MSTEQVSKLKISENVVSQPRKVLVVNALSRPLQSLGFINRRMWKEYKEFHSIEEHPEGKTNDIFETDKLFDDPSLRSHFEAFITLRCVKFFKIEAPVRVKQQSPDEIYVEIIENNIDHLRIDTRQSAFNKPVLIPQSLGLKQKHFFLSKDPNQYIHSKHKLTPCVAVEDVTGDIQIVQYSEEEKRKIEVLDKYYNFYIDLYKKLRTNQMLCSYFHSPSMAAEKSRLHELIEPKMFGDNPSAQFVRSDMKHRFRLEMQHVRCGLFDLPPAEDKHYDASDLTGPQVKQLMKAEARVSKNISKDMCAISDDEGDSDE